jgi:hypothetical protein
MESGVDLGSRLIVLPENGSIMLLPNSWKKHVGNTKVSHEETWCFTVGNLWACGLTAY